MGGWIGNTPTALTLWWQWYVHRYTLEHWYRFAKQREYWNLPMFSPDHFCGRRQNHRACGALNRAHSLSYSLRFEKRCHSRTLSTRRECFCRPGRAMQSDRWQ